MYRWSSVGSSRTCWHSRGRQAGDKKQGEEERKKGVSRQEAASTWLRLLTGGLCFPLFFLVKMRGTGKKKPERAIPKATWKTSTF